jgi:hypothetical protein
MMWVLVISIPCVVIALIGLYVGISGTESVPRHFVAIHTVLLIIAALISFYGVTNGMKFFLLHKRWMDGQLGGQNEATK